MLRININEANTVITILDHVALKLGSHISTIIAIVIIDMHHNLLFDGLHVFSSFFDFFCILIPR